jgi:putative hydrolase of the HAD superfamily
MLDVDGVVVRGRPRDGLPWSTSLEQDLGISSEQLHAILFAPHWDEIVTGRKELFSVLDDCMPQLTQSVTAKQLVDYWFKMDSFVDEAVLYACDKIRASGVRVFLATNQEHHRASYLVDRLRLGRHVDGMIYSAKVRARKPDLAFFQAAMAQTGFGPENLVLVDDTITNLDAARKAGWAALHWTNSSDLLRDLENLP